MCWRKIRVGDSPHAKHRHSSLEARRACDYSLSDGMFSSKIIRIVSEVLGGGVRAALPAFQRTGRKRTDEERLVHARDLHCHWPHIRGLSTAAVRSVSKALCSAAAGAGAMCSTSLAHRLIVRSGSDPMFYERTCVYSDEAFSVTLARVDSPRSDTSYTWRTAQVVLYMKESVSGTSTCASYVKVKPTFHVVKGYAKNSTISKTRVVAVPPPPPNHHPTWRKDDDCVLDLVLDNYCKRLSMRRPCLLVRPQQVLQVGLCRKPETPDGRTGVARATGPQTPIYGNPVVTPTLHQQMLPLQVRVHSRAPQGAPFLLGGSPGAHSKLEFT
ncbi:hypothetical protein EDB86DRAFT_3216751 [Lactarius hatsudake]|nr:hypothetical protein EDB86DRAFT_3216751 [Lactarius hatsudake]